MVWKIYIWFETNCSLLNLKDSRSQEMSLWWTFQRFWKTINKMENNLRGFTFFLKSGSFYIMRITTAIVISICRVPDTGLFSSTTYKWTLRPQWMTNSIHKKTEEKYVKCLSAPCIWLQDWRTPFASKNGPGLEIDYAITFKLDWQTCSLNIKNWLD